MKALDDKYRIHAISGLILIIAAILVSRLFFVQIIHGADYINEANDQYQSRVGNVYDRGSIYFKDKNGELISAATVNAGYIVSINPTVLVNPEKVYEQISKIIEIDKEDFFRKTAKIDDPYEEIAKKVTSDKAEEIRALGIGGVGTYREQWRYYPGKSIASHVLGFVGFNGDVLEGRYGVEREFEEVLHRGEYSLYNNFFAEIFNDVHERFFNREEAKEGEVVLTIEPNVQLFVENRLKELIEEWNADSGGVVIMDPNTGEIYAMGAYPDFDVNNFSDVDSVSVFSNPLVESVFEMGSTWKPLTIAAALDANVINSNTTYDDKGFVELNEERIENYDGKARGIVPIQEILNQSLNTGTVFAMQKLGRENFREYMINYGLSDTTGIDLPNEAQGITGNLTSSRDIEYATVSFGQGIAVNPIVMTRALSSLANGGFLIKPHVVDKLDYVFGFEEKREPIEQGRVLKQSTSEEITRMLVEVVDDALRGGKVKLDNYSIAAKTGTAQVFDPNNGGYYEDKFLHSFFGYAPAYDPKFIIFSYLVNPKEVRYASETLTSPFMDMTEFLISYYEIPPDR